VHIHKRIPTQAGLGGGSSDAAAALRALAALWCGRLEPARLVAIAARLGADVPYFFMGGTALGVERGDRVFPLADHPKAWVVIVRPDDGVSTADAYRWLDDHRARWARSRSKVVLESTAGSPGGLGPGPYGEGGNDFQAVVV
jgi:4-diphosphocytidyl-2-C-methyl-D-erythritol kinase